MLTGKLPSKTAYVPPSEVVFPVPDGLDQVLGKALAMNPAERYESAAAFAQDLVQVLEGMSEEYDVNPNAHAQQVLGTLNDVHSGHLESLDHEREQKEAAGDYEAAARLLQMRIDQIWNEEEKVYWMLKLARLAFEHLEMPGKAVAIYRDCLELAPSNRTAADALVKHFEATEQWEELLELLQDLKGQSETAEERVIWLQKMVEVAHVRLLDSAQAGAFMEELVETTGAEQRWIELLVRLKEEAQDYPGAVRALGKWLELVHVPEEKAGILKKLTEILHDKLEAGETSRPYFEQLLEIEPKNRNAMDALRVLYRHAFAYAALARLLRKMVASGAYEGQDLVVLHQELGEVLSSYVYDSAEAQKVWLHLLDLDPSNATALSYLERLYLREGQNQKYLAVLERRARLARPEERASVLLSAATARSEFLGDTRGARDLLEEALQGAPGHAGVESALERLYEEHKDVDAQARLLLARLEREESKSVRLQMLTRLATLFDQVAQDKPAAAQVLRQAFTESPRDPAIRNDLERVSREGGVLEDLVAFYIERMGEADRDLQDWLTSRVATLVTGDVWEKDKALFYLESARKRGGNSPQILKSLIPLYRDLEKWPDLAQRMLDMMDALEGEAREEAFTEVALLVKNRLKASPEGIACLDRLVSIAGQFTDSAVLDPLKEALRALEQWDKLAGLAQGELVRETDPVEIRRIRLEMAYAYQCRKDFASAAEVLQAVLEASPQDRSAQQSLEAVLAAREDWDALLQFYKRMVMAVGDPAARREYLEKGAEIEVRVFDRVDAAIESYRQLLALSPDHAPYYKGLAEVLKKGERWTDLAWHYEQFSRLLKGDDRLAILKELAELYEVKLENPDSALQAWRLVHKAAPMDRESFDRAVALCRKEKRHDALLKTLSDQARHCEPEERLKLLTEMGRVSALEMGLLPAAKTYLDEVLKAAPGHGEAFDLYTQILEKQGDWKEMARLLEKQFEALVDEDLRSQVGLRLAEVYETHLERRIRAGEVLEKVLELQPENLQAALRLARTYSDTRQWDRCAPLLLILKQFKEKLRGEEEAEYVFLSALTYEALLKRPEAIDAYRRAMLLNFRVTDVRKRLASLLYVDGQIEDARSLLYEMMSGGGLSIEETREYQNMLADIDRRLGHMERSREHLVALLERSPGDLDTLGKLADVCREEGDKPGEAQYLTQSLQVETDPERRFKLLVRLGDLSKEISGRETTAVEVYEKAAELNPTSRAVLVNLSQLYMKTSRYPDSARCLQQLENLETEVERKAALAMTQGLLYADYLKDPEQASVHLMRCLSYDPTKWDAFTRVEQFAVASGNWQQQRELYERVLSRVPEATQPELLFRLNLNLGRILLEKFGDSKAALAHIEAARAIHPDAVDAKELSAAIYLEGSDNVDKALTEYRSLVQHQPRDVSVLRMLRTALTKLKMFDEAWCVSGVLEFLNASTPKEKAFYEKFASAALKLRPKVIDVDMFRADLRSPDEQWELTEILRVLFERLSPKMTLKTARDMGLGKANQFEDGMSAMFPKLQDVLLKILGIGKVPVFVRENSPWVSKEGCWPSALVVGKDVFAAKLGKEFRFDLGRAMALFLPYHSVVGVLDRNALRTLLGNLIKVLHDAYPEPPGDARFNAEMRKEMSKVIPPVDMARFRDLIAAARDREEELNVKRWLVGVEKTASRLGLLFANDLAAAASVVKSSPFLISPAAREEVVDDLLRFWVSEGCARIRVHLGMDVGKS
jgi:tetratricopeptide (TPR) repeat protein